MSDRDRSKDKNGGKKKSGRGWALRVFVLAVVLSALLSFFSTTALEGTGYVVAALVLAVFIGLGIVFDMIGVAVTAADPKPFHSMAAHKEKGAKAAIRLLQNANQVSSVCNDVVGDICGIVSGSTAAVIVTHLQRDLSTTSVLISIGGADLRHYHRRQGPGQNRGHQPMHQRGIPGGPDHARPASLTLKWSDIVDFRPYGQPRRCEGAQ